MLPRLNAPNIFSRPIDDAASFPVEKIYMYGKASNDEMLRIMIKTFINLKYSDTPIPS